MADWLTTWTNLGAIVGIFVSVSGFIIAIVQIRRSRSAAEAEREAAVATRERLASNLTISDLTRASEKLREVTDLHLNGEWRRAIDRYNDIREMLADIRSQHPTLTDDQKTTLQAAIQQLMVLHTVVLRALREEVEPRNLEVYDEVLLRTDSLVGELAVGLRQSA